MPEQQPVADEAVQAAQTLLRRRVGYNEFCNRAEADAADMALLGPVVEAAAPFIRAPLEAENTRLREALATVRADLVNEIVEALRSETEWFALLDGSQDKRDGYALGFYEAADFLLRTFGGDRA